MPVSNKFPKKCHKCAKSSGAIINGKCNFCEELEFHEEILCDLNRCIQNPANFRCYAFQPILKLVSSKETKAPVSFEAQKKHSHIKALQELLHSDKIRYQRALALQKLNFDPNGAFIELKYHFVWNVIHRRPIFNVNNDIFDFIKNAFLECSELVGGLVDLLWIAPDHVHLYVESDADNSVETIAQEIKKISNNAILKKYVNISNKLTGVNEIWDKAYFVETIG